MEVTDRGGNPSESISGHPIDISDARIKNFLDMDIRKGIIAAAGG